MQKSRKTKGFTLTELAIVIAVIAILIAVLIPTFVSLINKANESSDSQLVKNLNTALSIDEATNGQPETMSGAVASAEANGYNVSNLTPTSSGYNIMWDQVSNRFFLVNEADEVVYADSSTGVTVGQTITPTYTYWRIVESDADYTNDNKGYSLYITTTLSVEVNSLGGVDFAEGVESTGTTTVTVTNGQTISTEGKALASAAIKTSGTGTYAPVIAKTNDGTVSIEVPSGCEAKHYGKADKAAVKGGSYTAYATLDTVEIAADSVSITIAESSEVSSLYVSADSITSVTITISSTNAITVGASTENLTNDLKITGNTSNVTKISSVCNDIALLYFAAGNGTSSNPYEINELAHMEGLRTLIENKATAGVYFKLTNDIDLGDDWEPLGTVYYASSSSGSVVVYSDLCNAFNGIFDGAKNDSENYTITMNDTSVFDDDNISYTDYALFAYLGKGAVIKNLNVYMQVSNYGTATCGAITSYAKGDGVYSENNKDNSILFENIKVTGTITAYAHAGGVVGWGATGCTFKNCTNEASITTKFGSSDKYSAIGGIAAMAGAYTTKATGYDASVVFDNCKNTGNLTHACETDGYWSNIGAITGMLLSGTSGGSYCTLTFTNCTCGGTISGIAKAVETTNSDETTTTTYYYYFEGTINRGTNSGSTTYGLENRESDYCKLLIGEKTTNTVIVTVNEVTTTYTTANNGIGCFRNSNNYALLTATTSADE